MKKTLSTLLITVVFLSACSKDEKIFGLNETKFKADKDIVVRNSQEDSIRIQSIKKFLSVLLSTNVDSVQYDSKEKKFNCNDKNYKIDYNQISIIYESANEYKVKYETKKN